MKLNFIKKHHRIIIWLIIVLCVIFFYFIKREWFNILFLESFIAEYRILAMIVYIFILSILGLFFIPSTPFAIAGVVLFSPVEAYLLNIIGILTSSTIVYYFAEFLKLDEIFEEKYHKKIKVIKEKLSDKELPIIIGWSFFPTVPTDVIIYASSSLKVPLWKCLLGVCIGEGILNFLYIFSAGEILKF